MIGHGEIHEPMRDAVWLGENVNTDQAMIWIGGSPGAGKSTLARLLAIKHDLPLHPIDRWTYVHAAIPPGSAVWLIPDADQTRRARLERLQRVDDPRARQLLDGLLQRDEVIAERTLTQAQAADRPVIKIGAQPDWPTIRDAVELALRSGLDQTERLSEGDALARQRRYENAAAAQQITLWTDGEGITPDPTFAFACECGRSGCALTWSATASDYRHHAEVGHVLAEPHMIN